MAEAACGTLEKEVFGVTTDWDKDSKAVAAEVTKIVERLLRLAADDQAARLLGIDGTLEDEIDVSFLGEPLNWIASEIANGIGEEGDDDEDRASLSTIVGLIRLCGIATGRSVEAAELRDAVIDYLDAEAE